MLQSHRQQQLTDNGFCILLMYLRRCMQMDRRVKHTVRSAWHQTSVLAQCA